MPSTGEGLPFVSVIMPIRNEASFIQRSLGSVLAQDYPPNHFEVIIVDGMSDDDTRPLIQGLSANTPEVAIQLIDNPQRKKPYALNLGIQQSQGEIVTIVDGHCEIETDYLSQCVKHLQAYDAAVVGGPIMTIGRGYIGEAIALGMSSSFGVGGAAFRTAQDKIIFTDTVAFGAYRREVLNNVGKFSEEFLINEDDEYNYRLRAMGYKILLTPHIRSRYYSRNSLYKLWQQYFKYGLYKVLVFKVHPRQMRLRQFIPFIFVLALIAGGILSVFSIWILRLWLLVIGSYVIVNLAASIERARKVGWKYLFILPLVYAILHLSYGLGFFVGLIRWQGKMYFDH